jgi:membrane associated rhomboid family serine protease
MIPLRDVIPSRTAPVVTIALIAANAVVFLYQRWLPERDLLSLMQTFGVVPLAFAWPAVATSMFLHAGWLHLIGNMLFLWIFGDNVEDRMGHGRFLVFYGLCGTAAALAQVAADPSSGAPMVGASGAIAGVMGAYLVLFPRSRVLTLLPFFVFWDIIEVPAIFFLGFWFVMQLFSSLGTMGAHTADAMGAVAFWAHAAGFAAGAAAVFVFRRPDRQRIEWWNQPG